MTKSHSKVTPEIFANDGRGDDDDIHLTFVDEQGWDRTEYFDGFDLYLKLKGLYEDDI